MYILALAVPVTVLAYIFRRPILLTFGATEAVYPYAETYFSLYLIGTVFALTATGMNQFIITQGHSRSGMFSVLIGAIINIVLDPIFIFALHMASRRGHRHGHFAGCKLCVRAVRPVRQTYRSSHHIWRIRFKSHRPCDEHRHERVPHYSFR